MPLASVPQLAVLSGHLLAATSTKPTTTTSSGAGALLVYIFFGVVFYMLYRAFMKPKQRAAIQQRDVLNTLEAGDEVLTGAGIFGTIQEIRGDRVTMWTGSGSSITVLRKTIVEKVTDPTDENDDDDHDHEGDDDLDDRAEVEDHNGGALDDTAGEDDS